MRTLALLGSVACMSFSATAFAAGEEAGSTPAASNVAPTAATTGTTTVSVAPRLGLTVPMSELGAFVVAGLSIAAHLPVLENRLLLALDAAWTRPGHKAEVADARVGGAQSYELSVNQLKLALDVIYRLSGSDTFGQLIPYVGIGPMLVLTSTSENAAFIPDEQHEQSRQFGFELALGCDYALGPGWLFGDLRYGYAGIDQTITGDSNLGSVNLAVGYRLGF